MRSVSVLDASGPTLRLAAPGGMLTLDAGQDDPAAWVLTRWPEGLGRVHPWATCMVDDEVLVLTTDLPPEVVQSSGVPQNVFVTTLALDGLAVLRTQEFGERLDEPTTHCLPDRALLFNTSQGEVQPIQRVTPDGATPWAGRTTGPGSAFIGAGIDVGTGIFSGGPVQSSTYVDQATGEVTQLAPISATDLEIWTGDLLLVVTQAGNRLMAMRPAPSWEESAGSAFPERIRFNR